MEGKRFMFDLQRFDDPIELTMKDYGLYAGEEKVETNQTTINKKEYTFYKLESGNYVVNDSVELDKSIVITGAVNITVNENSKLSVASSTNGILNGPLNVAYGGDLTVNGSGTINGGSCGICVTVGPNQSGNTYPYNTNAENYSSAKAKLTVDGNLTIEGTDYGISGNGSRNGTEITINGGTIKATGMHNDLEEKPQNASQGIFHPQDGTLTINGGNISGETGIEIRSGNLVIPKDSTATITATATVYSVGRNGNGGTTAGAAIAISQHVTAQKIDADIAAGNFSGQVALSVSNPEENTTNDPEVEIDGGTFESTAADTAAIAAQNADSRVSIKVKSGTFKGTLASTFATISDDNKFAAIEIRNLRFKFSPIQSQCGRRIC